MKMTNFLHWRKMTWALILWGAALAAGVLLGSIGVALAALWLAGLISLVGLWLLTPPLFRQGRGFRALFGSGA